MSASRLIWNHELHRLGEEQPVERHSVRQGLAWMLAADLVRRHPGELRIFETHPHGYDQVSVFRKPAPEADQTMWDLLVHFNKEAGGHITPQCWFAPGDHERLTWLEVLLSQNPRTDIIEPLERAEGLPSPSVSPATTSWSIGPRVLAAFAQRAMFAPKPWLLLEGMADGDYGIEPREWLFKPFKSLAALDEHPSDPFFGPASRYWFVIQTDEPYETKAKPALAVDTITGVAHTTTETVDLLAAYKKAKKNLDLVTAQVCPGTA